MAITVLDFIPSYCPHCGKPITFKDRWARDDYWLHASHSCPHCDISYQYAHTEDVLKAATNSGGDMEKYQ